MTAGRDWLPAALVALCLLTYGPSLANRPLVVNELTIIGRGFAVAADGLAAWGGPNFRPLMPPLYAGIALAAGPQGWAFHSVLLVFHVLVVLWVYGVGVRLLGDRTSAGLGAAWFAVSWMKYENVVWIGGLESVVGSACAALALWAFTTDREHRPGEKGEGWRARLLTPAAFIAMLFLYQAALLLPVLLVWHDHVTGRDSGRRRPIYVVTAAALAIWIVAAMTLTMGPAFPHTVADEGGGMVRWGFQFIRNLGSVFGYLYFPFDALGRVGAGLKHVLGLATAGWLVWLAWRGTFGERLLAGGTLLVTLPILLRTLVEARYGYLVSAGVFLLLAQRMVRWGRVASWRRAAVGLVVAVGLAASVEFQWEKSAQYRTAGLRVWEILDQLKRDVPVWPARGAVVEGLPLWENREQLPVPLFGNTLRETVIALYREPPARAWYDWESGIPPTASRILFLDGRFVVQP